MRSSEANLRFLIECKRFRADRIVGVEVVRALYGVKIHAHATKAMLAITSTFTRDANKFLTEHLWELDGKDYLDVLGWIQRAKR